MNSELDAALLGLLRTLAGHAATSKRVDSEWSVLQVAAHLAEFPRYFATDLGRWKADPSVVIGRTHDHPARLAAVNEASASQLALATLSVRAHQALGELAQALSELSDEDLAAPTINVKYGREPLSSFVDRYVVEHKRGHIGQLERFVTAGD